MPDYSRGYTVQETFTATENGLWIGNSVANGDVKFSINGTQIMYEGIYIYSNERAWQIVLGKGDTLSYTGITIANRAFYPFKGEEIQQ